MQTYENREEGGRALASALSAYKNAADAIILALPRGGVPVAYEVAEGLNLPMDVLVVRKLGVPGQEELAFGAIASGGLTILNESLVQALSLPDTAIRRVTEREKKELDRRTSIYRKDRPPLEIEDKTVIVVDDGLATGATMRAAVATLKLGRPKEVIVAVPVGSRDTCSKFESGAELCVCTMTPEPFYGVGMWYRDFGQTSDEEVCRLLEEAAANRRSVKAA